MTTSPEYCLLWVNWWPLCMQKSEWASWVQAVGSIIAIAIAVAIPLILHANERRTKLADEISTAKILSIGINVTISQTRGALAGILQNIENLRSTVFPGQVAASINGILSSLKLPSETQLMLLKPVGGSTLTPLVFALTLLEQERLHFSRVCASEIPQSSFQAQGRLLNLEPNLAKIEQYLDLAQEGLSKFLTLHTRFD